MTSYNRKAVVTGGAGFIGSHLTEELLEQGYRVTVIDDLSTGSLSNLEHLKNNRSLEFVKGSITDLSLLQKVLAGADYVFHQAAIPSVPRSIENPAATHEVNATGTLNVLMAARECGVRKVVYASSSSVYGDAPSLPKKEQMRPAPLSPYAVSKLTGEYYCAAFTAVYGLPAVALRYFNVYGPRQAADSAYAAVIPRFMAAIQDGKGPVIYRDGEQTRDFPFVKDVVRANLQAAEIFGVSRRAVSRWMSADRQGGKEALKAKRRGRPRGGVKLKPWKCATIVNPITDRHPDQLKLPFYLWTRQAVVQLIEQRFGIRYSVYQVGRYLKQWGFTVQKPGRKAFEQCPWEVQNWLENEYPIIKRQAKAENAEIQWCDEMGVRSDAASARCFSPKGQTPIVLGTGKRFGCNMISSISNRGTLRFMVFTDRFNSDVMLRFLKRLLKQMERKVFLIVDGHPVHRGRAVKKFVAEKKDRIQLFHLPAYSPELNPDEMLNQDVKTNAVRRKPATTQSGMMRNLRGYLRSRQRRPELVKRYFHAPTVRYAAA